ncbi:MAG: hypothetical protein D6712_19270, partial [Chloroflexi bacterium]
MLIRAYRLTDKLGLFILKFSSALVQTAFDGVHLFVYGAGGGAGSILGVIFTLIVGLVTLLLGGVRRLLAIIKGILAFIWGIIRGALLRVWAFISFIGVVLFRLLGRASGSAVRTGARSAKTVAASAAGTPVTGTMAHPKPQDVPVVEQLVIEDPLRTSNRVLSGFFILLGIVVIGVILYATDPARSARPVVPGSVVNPAGSVLLNEPEPTTNPISSVQNTPIPTATPVPEFLQVRGTIAYTIRENGQTDIWAVGVGNTHPPLRLTNDPADDRDPAWSPDGTRLAFASHRDGNWDIYIYNVITNETQRMTFDISFQARPAWSPDSGEWLVYESYQNGNLDIWVLPVDGSQPPQALTTHPAPDFSPAWSPLGREIAFVSWRDGNQDIYIFSLDTGEVFNLTNTPERFEDYPSWSPDGQFIAYSALDNGVEKVFVKPAHNPGATPTVLGAGHTPSWSPDGLSLVFAADTIDGTHLFAMPYNVAGAPTSIIAVQSGAAGPSWTSAPLPAAFVNSGGLEPAQTEPLYTEQASLNRNGKYGLGDLSGVNAPLAYLSDRVNDSFNALRERVLEEAGWDFLGQLEDAFWDTDRPPQPGESPRDWHKTGRAFSIRRDSIYGFPPPVEIVREDIGLETYWRVYVRVAEDAQDGQLGEPLRRMPWDFLSAQSGDIEAYTQGGRLRSEMPQGYYIDFTQLAADYGWERVPAGSDW